MRLFANLAFSANGRQAEFRVNARPGLTVQDVADQEGIASGEVQLILVNGRRARLDTFLADGDRLGLFPAVGGG